jgi:phospholysine phosphohistidine inorganic pyrophosphate phosphatase
VRRPLGVLLDLDGTVYEEERLVPGATEAIERLRASGIPVRFVTNTTRMPRRALRERLASFGVPAEVDEIITAPTAAALWLRSERLAPVSLHVNPATEEDFSGLARDDVRPAAVVVGDLGAGWTFARLNAAFRQVLAGGRLVALQRNRYWKTADGLALDAGAFVAALEYAAGVSATVVGKPSHAFFTSAMRTLGDVAPTDVVVVGDDATTDVAGAKACGCVGVLVRTGKYRAEDERTTATSPDAVVDSVAELPTLFGL